MMEINELNFKNHIEQKQKEYDDLLVNFDASAQFTPHMIDHKSNLE